MTEEEQHAYNSIDEAIQSKNMHKLVGQAVWELWRIANAQEKIVAFASADLEAQIEEAIKSRAEDRAAEMVADKTRRSFIGKKQST